MSQIQRTVLIVDDSPEDCEVYRRYLLRDEEYQYTVMAAGLGKQGLALFHQHQPDVVLLDYRLPDLDGLEFLVQLKAQTQQIVLPVIMLTGRGNEEIAVQSMKMGAQDYLVKEQVTPKGLRLAVNGAIEMVQLRIQLQQRIKLEQAARAKAETANRIKDEFLSNLSHELRNPLNTILGWAQLLRTGQLDETTVTRALDLVERSAKAQAQLIEDLLDVSRITSGKLHLNTRLIDLVSVVGAAIESVHLSAEAKNIQIISQLKSVTIVGDADRLQQVFWNLLSNAIKFTPSGGRVEITLEPVQTYAEIQVSDTGQGIPADLLPYVFERFRQGDSSSSKASQGLGLGLSIAHQVVELHSGTIQVESLGKGKGATFKVQLPLLKTTNKETENFTSSPHHPIKPSRLDGLRVLVVDDDAGVLELLKTILEQYEAEVTAVTSAKEALAALTANPGRHDVLLSDIGMPSEDGYALLRQVRALSAELGGQIPAVALTAYARVEEQSASLEAGFQRHIAKPVEPAQLVAIIAKLAGRN